MGGGGGGGGGGAAPTGRTDPRPACPFCAAAWTDAMVEAFVALSRPCACCGGTADDRVAALPVPTRDLACAACGRAIYRAPHAQPK